METALALPHPTTGLPQGALDPILDAASAEFWGRVGIEPMSDLSLWEGDISMVHEKRFLHARAWPRPYARTRRGPDDPWKDCHPWLDVTRGLLVPHFFEPTSRIDDWVPDPPPRFNPEPWVVRALERIPAEVRAAIAPFQYRQWPLLRLADACPRSVDLARSNPALAWALAEWPRFRRAKTDDPFGPPKSLVASRQRDVAAWLGFPRTESAVRLLRKIPPADCAKAPIAALRALLREGQRAEPLRHFPELPAIVLLAATAPRVGAHLTPACLQEIADAAASWSRQKHSGRDRFDHPARLLHDTVHLAKELADVPAPGEIRSLGALHRFHDHLTHELRFRRQFAEDFELPAPPIPGAEGIEPLATARAVFVEGEELRHCLVSYLQRMEYRGYYAYRVTRHGRATVGIQRTRDGSWQIDQIRGRCNSRPPRALRDSVTAWFHAHIAPTEATHKNGRAKAKTPDDADLQLVMPFATSNE